MVNNTILEKYLSEYLNVSKFSDYCPNGLQVEGKSDICKIISGVSANQDLIDQKIIYSRIINLIKAEISNGSKDYDLEYIRNHIEKLTS